MISVSREMYSYLLIYHRAFGRTIRLCFVLLSLMVICFGLIKGVSRPENMQPLSKLLIMYCFLTLDPYTSSRFPSDIDRWILHLSRNSIKEFILEIWTWCRYSIHSCLFSCLDIIHLELYHCLLKLPPKFKGLGSLKRMDFQRVHLSQDVLENMIVFCPLLEKLTLANCDGFTRFKINAPNLQMFDLEGDYEDFILENTSNLAQVCIDLDVKVDQRQILDSNSSNLLKFFADLPNIRRLKIQSCILKYLAVGALPEKLPEPCLHLEFLSVCISFSDLDKILTLLCLLRSSPALKNLEILVPQQDHAVARVVKSWLYDNVNCHCTQLRLVKITGLSCVKAALDFTRFLLLSSPVLKKMTIKPTSVIDIPKLDKELLGFRCASERAKIFYLGRSMTHQ